MLWYLLARPGKLTVDYFAERRARYLPPIRVNLVLSVIFFGIGGGGIVINDTSNDRVSAARGDAGKSDGDEPVVVFDQKVGETLSSNSGCGSIRLASYPRLQGKLQQECQKLQHISSRDFLRAVGHNAPRMMFVFLPLMASLLTLLYLRSHHFYVEHLVYLLHNHSALFLMFSLAALLARLRRSPDV